MDLSSDYGWVYYIFYALLAQLPLYLIYLVGAVIALTFLKKHQRIAIYTIAALLILFVTSVASTFAQASLPSYLVRQGVDSKSIGAFYYGLGIITSLFHVLGFSLLLLAIFSGRSKPRARSQVE